MTDFAPVTLLADTESPDSMLLFIPEPSEIVWSAIVIAILAVAFIKFFLPMLNDILAKRSEKIEGEIVSAAELKREAEELHATYSTEIKSAKLESAQIKDDARMSAAKIIQDAHQKASAESELMISNARRAIDSEKKSAETELMKHTNSIAMNIVQRMLNTGVDNKERQGRMIDQSIDRFAQVSKPARNKSSAKGTANSTANSTRSRVRRNNDVVEKV